MVRAFRDTWHLGVHSYLSYLRDRLINNCDAFFNAWAACVRLAHILNRVQINSDGRQYLSYAVV